MKETAKSAAPVGELCKLETALNNLEKELGDLKEFLHMVDRRRGLVDVGCKF
jgi:hypothetical protein